MKTGIQLCKMIVTRCPFHKFAASWTGQASWRLSYSSSNLIVIPSGCKDAAMPRPFASPVVLSPDQREMLDSLIRARSTPQALVFRCRVVVRASEPDTPSNQVIAKELNCHRHTVGQWRERFVAQGIAGLQDAPRSGRPRIFSPRRTSSGHYTRQQQDGRTPTT
jgi:hypothetical protein